MKKGIFVIIKHKAFFDNFDKIIVYYDNGQIELGAILSEE